ncbi:Rab-like protein 6 [Holothuria leucospilota]|uniref:Rab-like protein 6 n=1 Tax=Holothuria leucospilota TaxID=206669 RepID=A0A9Q1C6L7_HOLLE|nr:Rab-like protein 6 [Holothuria leucospilota]
MISALKKLVATDPQDGTTKGDVPDGMHTMGQSLQRRFAKGVQYNMKVIIKGDRNTGKSTLFRRLQGEKFREEYIPTPEIQVASIQWGYKATDDIVKVEVWDVVDKGKTKKHSDSLKLGNETDEIDEQPRLDASFLDVYKGTHGVVMVLDITKQWTWQYIERELPKVPDHIPVLVMGNMRDMGQHRTVDEEDTRFYIEHYQRSEGSAPVMYAESSMKNGFGLKYLHTFFNIPYLQLQKETLLRQLETNKLEADATKEELQLRKESEDQNYDLYLASLDTKKQKRQKKPVQSSPQTPSLSVPNGQTQQAASSSTSSTPAKISPASTPPSVKKEIPVAQAVELPVNAPPPPSVSEPPAQTLSQKFSRWFGSSEAKIEQGRKDDGKTAVIEPPAEIITKPSNAAISSVEDFVPDEGIDRSFFEDEPQQRKASKKKQKKENQISAIKVVEEPEASSDSDDGGNPMVAGFQEELDSEDDGPETLTTEIRNENAKKKVSSRDIDLSSDSEPETPVVQADEDIDSSDNEDKSRMHVYDADKTVTPQKDFYESSKVPKGDSHSKTHKTNLQLDVPDSSQNPELQRSSSSEPESATSPSSAGIQLQLEDLNFLESVTSKSSKTSSSKKSSLQPNYEFDSLVNINDEEPSGTETSTTTASTGSSAKKKKSRTKDRDEEKSHRKHKHKKHRDRESKDSKEEKGEKKKKKKSKRKEENTEEKTSMDALEMFLEGTESGGYEAI